MTVSMQNKIEKAVNTFKLPYLYGTVKTHKQPYGWRYIAGGQDVAINLVADWVHSCLSAMMDDVHSMAREAMAGVVPGDPRPCEGCFAVSDSRDVVRRVVDLERRRREQLQAHRRDPRQCRAPRRWQAVEFGVHDFTTLYPTLPHDHIRESVFAIIDEVFQMQQQQMGGDECWLGVDRRRRAHIWKKAEADGAGGTRRPSNAGTWRYFAAAEIQRDISFILDNTFITVGDEIHRQACGVPMGLICSPMLAVIMLARYEIRQLRAMVQTAQQQLGTVVDTPHGACVMTEAVRVQHLQLAARFSRCCRAIDDVLMIDISKKEQEWLLERTYPQALALKAEHVSPARILYLDMEIKHDRGGFYTVLYDKRDELKVQGKMGDVRRFPHPSSVLSKQCKVACLTTFLHRAQRVCMRRKQFVEVAAARMVEMAADGYAPRELRAAADKFIGTYISPPAARAFVKARLMRKAALLEKSVAMSDALVAEVGGGPAMVVD